MTDPTPPRPQDPDAEPESGQRPALISRRQEKEMLQGLNSRLLTYTEKVQNLQRENGVLRQRVSQREEVCKCEVSGLKAAFEAKLAESRQALENASRERAKLQVDLRRIRVDYDQLLDGHRKRESDFSDARRRIQELEQALSSKEAALTVALNEKRCLEGEADDLKAQAAELQLSLASSKDEVARETLAKMDLVNRVQTLNEDLELCKNIHNQEISEARRRVVTLLAQVNLNHQAKYEQRLAQALREIREQHSAQMQLYKNDLEQTYHDRLDNAIRSAMTSRLAADSAREELNASRVLVNNMCSHITILQREAIVRQDRAQELEENLSKNWEDYHRAQREKEREVREMRSKIQEQLSNCEQLLDVKLALDMEIGAYRRLLETEEERLQNPQSSSSQAPVSQASSSQNVHTSNQKRRRTGMAAYEASIGHRASATGNVCIEEIDIGGKFIRLKNTSEQDQPMGGWMLTREIRGTSVTYRYSSEYVLQAGQTVTIWAANAGITSRPPTDLIWENENSWDTPEDVKVVLKNSVGLEVAERTLFFRINVSEGEEDEMENQSVKRVCSSQQAKPESPARNCVLM